MLETRVARLEGTAVPVIEPSATTIPTAVPTVAPTATSTPETSDSSSYIDGPSQVVIDRDIPVTFNVVLDRSEFPVDSYQRYECRWRANFEGITEVGQLIPLSAPVGMCDDWYGGGGSDTFDFEYSTSSAGTINIAFEIVERAPSGQIRNTTLLTKEVNFRYEQDSICVVELNADVVLHDALSTDCVVDFDGEQYYTKLYTFVYTSESDVEFLRVGNYPIRELMRLSDCSERESLYLAIHEGVRTLDSQSLLSGGGPIRKIDSNDCDLRHRIPGSPVYGEVRLQPGTYTIEVTSTWGDPETSVFYNIQLR